MTNRKHHGFTLVEMLVIIAIIGILVGILMPSVAAVKRGIMRSASQQTVNLLASACRTFAADFNGAFPDSTPATISGTKYEGRHRLVQALTGYFQDTNKNTTPTYFPAAGIGTTTGDSDGADGYGFRTEWRGRVYGPYNGAENVKTAVDKTTGQALKPLCFVDNFGSEIYYYKYNPDFNAGAGGYDPADNTAGASPAGLLPPTLPVYAQDDGGNYFTKDFIIMAPGPDQAFSAWKTDKRTDDAMSFRNQAQ